MNLFKRVALIGGTILALVAGTVSAQQVQDSTVCSACVPVVTPVLDSTIASIDTTWQIVSIDSTWNQFTRPDTTWRDSTIEITVPLPPPLVLDTVGFKQLVKVDFTKEDDRGQGPVLLGANWNGNMHYATDATMGTMARYTYTLGQKSGVSPGEVWAEVGMTGKNARDVYVRMYVRYSSNFVNPSSKLSKLFLIGFGYNGNQLVILNYHGKYAVTWQGNGTDPLFTQVGTRASAKTVASKTSINEGAWELVEFQAHSGPAGTKSSWSKMWVNRVLVTSESGFDIVKPTFQPQASALKLSPVWGGNPDPVEHPTQIMTLDIAHVFMSGK